MCSVGLEFGMELGFGLLGAGNLGLSIASALQKAGARITGVCDPNQAAQKRAVMVLDCPLLPGEDLARSSDVLLFAVPDDEIAPLYERLPQHISETCLLVHFSGVITSSVFDQAPMRLSAHPAKAFPLPHTGKDAFKDVFFALEGTDCAVELLKPVLEKIGAKTFFIAPDRKPLYHVACVMTSNLVLGLLDAAGELNRTVGIDEAILRRVILDFAQGTISDAKAHQTLVEALSGPITRGDKSTLALHLKVLERFPAQHKLYRLLSQWVLELAKEKGLPEVQAREIEELLLR